MSHFLSSFWEGSDELEPSGWLTDLCLISWAPGLYPVSLTHWRHDLCRLLCSFLDHQFQVMLLSCPHCANEIFISWIHRISAIHQYPSIHKTCTCPDFLFRGRGVVFPKWKFYLTASCELKAYFWEKLHSRATALNVKKLWMLEHPFSLIIHISLPSTAWSNPLSQSLPFFSEALSLSTYFSFCLDTSFKFLSEKPTFQDSFQVLLFG